MRYFCHTCDREVPHASSQANGELLCSICLEPYVEIIEGMDIEIEDEPQAQPEQPQAQQNESSFHYEIHINNNGVTQSFSSSRGGAMPPSFMDRFANAFAPQANAQAQPGNGGFFSFGPANITSFVLQSNQRGGAQFGDYYMGDMNRLLGHLQRRHEDQGKPPASADAISQLETQTLCEEAACKLSEVPCAVCQDKYQEKEVVVCLPCGHKYHRDCVVPWLERHCTCPVCRYEVKSEQEMQPQEAQQEIQPESSV